MSEIRALVELIDPVHFVEIEDGLARLEETEDGAKLRCVKLSGLPRDACILKLEGLVGRFFKQGCRARKCCDYLVLAEIKGKLHLLYIELKSSYPKNDKMKGVRDQMKGAECAMEYCNAVLYRFFGKIDYLKTFEKRFFVLYALPTNKSGSVKQYPTNSADEPYCFPINPQAKYPVRVATLIN